MLVPTPLNDTLDEAIGRRRRHDPIEARTGGPAGNARLTAWTGLALLGLILGELVTLLDVSGLIGWHVVIGTMLTGLALLKTASTSWRAGRFYTGRASYRVAGPPPTPLRLLGPVVVVTTLGLLGSGLALIALGPPAGRRPFVTVFGFGLDTLTLHQALFFAFAASVGLHALARVIPAVTSVAGRVERRRTVPGGSGRIVALGVSLVVAALVSALILGTAGSWRHDDHRFGRPGGQDFSGGSSGQARAGG